MAVLNERGHEVLDQTPIEIPVGYKFPESIQDQIRRFVRQELSQQASAAGHESFDDADDFNVEDDDGYDPSSPWELNFDQEQAARPSQRKREAAPKHEHHGGDAPRAGSRDQSDEPAGKNGASEQAKAPTSDAERSDAK